MSVLSKPIESSNRTLAAHVHARIREAILTGELKPGVRIDQNQIAASLNVSLAPIREALKGLEAERFVTIFPRRGVFVAAMSVTDMDELYNARALIEGQTLYQTVPLLTEADLNEAQQRIQRMIAVSAEGDVTTYITLNRDFHMSMYRVLGNQTLLAIIQNLWERSELYRYRYVYSTHNPPRVHQEHQLILDTCRAKDQAAAREAAIAHIQHTQNELRDLLSLEGERSET